jgi:hypothetical protein
MTYPFDAGVPALSFLPTRLKEVREALGPVIAKASKVQEPFEQPAGCMASAA